MPANEPTWWYDSTSSLPRLLSPLARVWGWAAVRRMRTAEPYRSALPVICIGNFTAGGTGKTPLAILVAGLLAARGERPAFLTRGYGGRFKGPRLVDRSIDTAGDVGDEALLLARAAPTVIARDRASGAGMLESFAGLSPPTVIVMDDGLQNPGLVKDLTIAVVDGGRGLGNGQVMPAGPLRAPLAFQLGLADAIVVNRPVGSAPGESEVARTLRQSFEGPVLETTVEPAGDAAALGGAKVLALAGIGNPGRFHRLLESLGAEIVERKSFRDHHAFSAREAEAVLARATELGARIVTTEKDWVRLAGRQGTLAELQRRAMVVPIRLKLDERDAVRLASLIDATVTEHRRPVAISAAAPSS